MNDTNERKLYSIGQAAEICAVSQRTLRYYESKNLISPDQISESGYRYYTMDTLRRVQIIRYYADDGFSLDNVSRLLNSKKLEDTLDIFRNQMEETQDKIDYYYQRFSSIKDWYAAIAEGSRVLTEGSKPITTKYMPTAVYFTMEADFDATDPDAAATLETEYYTKTKTDGHSMVDVGGAFILHHNSIEDRFSETLTTVTMIQPIYPHARSMSNTRTIDGFTAVSAYHIGNTNTLHETYDKAINWARLHNFQLCGDSYERYVIDLYSTMDENQYVTEILLPIKMDNRDLEFLSEMDKFV